MPGTALRVSRALSHLVPVTTVSEGPALAPLTEEETDFARVTQLAHCRSGSGAQTSLTVKPRLFLTTSPLPSHCLLSAANNKPWLHVMNPLSCWEPGVFQKCMECFPPSASRDEGRPGPPALPQVSCLTSSTQRQHKVVDKDVGSEIPSPGYKYYLAV